MRRITPLLLLLLCLPALADVLLLKDGRRFEGTVKKETSKEVVFTTEFGDLTFKMSEVSKIEKGKTKNQEFNERYKAAKTAKEFYELGVWADENRMRTNAKRAMRKAKDLEPQHEGANTWLGLTKYKGQWVTAEELEQLKKRDHASEMKKRGLVEHGGEWVTLEEKAKLDAGLVYHEGKWVTLEVKKRAEGFVLKDGEWVLFHIMKAEESCNEVLKLAKAKKGKVVIGADHAVAGPFDTEFLEDISIGLARGRAWFDSQFQANPGVSLLGGRAAEFYVWGRDSEQYTSTVDHLAAQTDSVPPGWADVVKKTHGLMYWDPYCCSSARAKGRPLEDLGGHSYHHWGHLLLNRHRYDGKLLPPWFDEGFAALFEFRTHDRNAVFCLGKPATIVSEVTGRTSGKRKVTEYVFETEAFRKGEWGQTLGDAIKDETASLPTLDQLAKTQFGELTLLDIGMASVICMWLESNEGALERFHASLRTTAPAPPSRILFDTPARRARYDTAFQAAMGVSMVEADKAWRAWFLEYLEEEGKKSGKKDDSSRRRRRR